MDTILRFFSSLNSVFHRFVVFQFLKNPRLSFSSWHLLQNIPFESFPKAYLNIHWIDNPQTNHKRSLLSTKSSAAAASLHPPGTTSIKLSSFSDHLGRDARGQFLLQSPPGHDPAKWRDLDRRGLPRKSPGDLRWPVQCTLCCSFHLQGDRQRGRLLISVLNWSWFSSSSS